MAFVGLEAMRVREIRATLAETGSISETARRCGVSRHTVRRYGLTDPAEIKPASQPAEAPPTLPAASPALPMGKHEQPAAASPALPDPLPQSYAPYEINTPGAWLVISDVHLPYHDRRTIEAAVREARDRRAVGVLLNGDTLDSHEISRHDRDPAASRYVDEIEKGRAFLAWLRDQFPAGRVVWKDGNHEERLDRYILNNAPALFGLEGLDLGSLLGFEALGVEYVTDRRVITLGRLNVVHGHEYQGGAASPVNPARGLYLKARSVALCGHHHQTSEHHARDIRGRAEAAWSTGCACFLSPRYCRLNNWNHGYAVVELSAGGEFSVTNRRLV